jgi:hypothetical protein
VDACAANDDAIAGPDSLMNSRCFTQLALNSQAGGRSVGSLSQRWFTE